MSAPTPEWLIAVAAFCLPAGLIFMAIMAYCMLAGKYLCFGDRAELRRNRQ